MNITYGTILDGREYIKTYINSQRQPNPNYRVIDIGGIALNGQDDMSGTASWSQLSKP